MKKIGLFFLILSASAQLSAQTKLWGVTAYGGTDNAGTIFTADINGNNQTVEYNFNQTDGSGNGIASSLMKTSDGRCFGMTPNGGKYNSGVLFEYNPATNAYTKKFDFGGPASGKHPHGALMQALNGKLYGMTNDGGVNNMGTVFEYDHISNTLTKILDFNGTNGQAPYGNLFQAQDGMLYGLTNRGGSTGGGVLFKLDPTTYAYTLKYDFSVSSNGYGPNGTLIQAPDGKLYGLASGGGSSANGALFQYDLTTNTYTKKIDFNGAGNGSRPGNDLLLASDDMMYGLSYYGGANDKGVLFQYDYHTGTFTKKYDFTVAGGANPWGSLIQASDGNFYGVTDNGGSGQNVGSLYQYNPNTNVYTKKFDFGAGNGSHVRGSLFEAVSGKLYAVGDYGINGLGVIFEYNIPSSAYTKKIEFGYSPGGRVPQYTLLKARDGKLYGISVIGGANNLGTIFRYDPVTHVQSTVFSFDSITGYNQKDMLNCRTLIEAQDGMFYGTTTSGGTSNLGTLFQFNPLTMAYSKKYDFSNNGNGSQPVGTLLETSSGILYGLTNSGGGANSGTIYQYNTVTGTYAMKYGFPVSSNGNRPKEMVQVNDSTLFGIASAGGTGGGGVIFLYNVLRNTYLKKYDFSNAFSSPGYSPASFKLVSDGKLYGAFGAGGSGSIGGVFSYDPSVNVVNYIHSFLFVDGKYSFHNMMEATNGKIYGLTMAGGANDMGTLFRVDPVAGTFTKMFDFSGPDGNGPATAGLIEVGDTIITKQVIATTCGGSKIKVPFAMVGNFQTGNNFKVQLSDASGSFASPLILGSFTAPLIGSVNVTVPSSVTAGVGYRVRVVSTNPVMIGNDNGSDITIHAYIPPTVAVSNGTICSGKTFTMAPTGCVSYTYSSGTATVNPTRDSTYTIIGADMYGCLDTAMCTVYVNPTPTVAAGSSTTIACEGSPVTLTASGAASYTWNPGALSGSTVVVTPTITTTYSVTGANAYGCQAIANLNINVTGSNVSYVINPALVCQGTTATITASGLNTYTWYPGAVTGNSISVTATAPAIYTVQGTFAMGCIATKTINFAPASVSASVSSAAICSGSPVSLYGSGMSTYTWNPGSMTGSTVMVTPTLSTTYTLTGSTGTCSSTQTVLVNVSPIPTLSVSGGTICSGQSFTINPTGAGSYTYSGGAAIVSPTVTTTYTVTGSSGGSCTDTKTLSVIVNAIPSLTLSPTPTITCVNSVVSCSVTGGSTYMWSGPGIVSGAATAAVNMDLPGVYSVMATGVNGCTATNTLAITANAVSPMVNIVASVPAFCEGGSASIFANASPASVTYLWNNAATTESISVSPTVTTVYSATVTDATNGCYSSRSFTVTVYPLPTLTVSGTNSICIGSGSIIDVTGAVSYAWDNGAATSSISVNPMVTTTYTVTGTSPDGCLNTETVTVTVDNTCADVWPGDANSDGAADNLDILELGLHYTQTGAPRAVTGNNWQAYFANNWSGTISSGKNLSHSDCNGDGTINDDDTLAIYTNYGLTHAFRPGIQSVTNPQLSIVPDQAMVVKGTWGTASVYLGDVSDPINSINGVAFTVDFDHTLIEPNSIYLEYQNSFVDAGQNLYFRKLDFPNGKIFTATTHTLSNNVSGYGKIATLHYQVLSTLATDEVLNIGLSLANQSDASGVISPVTAGTGTLMAIGASVGLKEAVMNANILISPNPVRDVLNISFTTLSQNARIELYNSIGALLLAENVGDKIHRINTSELSNGLYFIKVFENNKVIAIQKIVKQ